MPDSERGWYQPELLDSVDSYPDLRYRREINDYAETKVDFNFAGMEAVKRHTELTSSDAILDVGCSSGRFAIEAAQRAEISSYLIGLDIVDYSAADYAREGLDVSKFSFMLGSGEDIPLPDSSVKAVTAHNVLFRSRSAETMLAEFKRVTEPDGLILISTNARDHAALRHTVERLAALEASMTLGIVSEPINPPAEGFYLEEIPALIERSGGMSVLEQPESNTNGYNNLQDSYVKIYRGDRLETFTTSIELSANSADQHYEMWRDHYRAAVRDILSALVKSVFARQRQYMVHTGSSRGFKPYLLDRVHRGMFVLQNIK